MVVLVAAFWLVIVVDGVIGSILKTCVIENFDWKGSIGRNRAQRYAATAPLHNQASVFSSRR